jgi:hypothetical protein
MIIAMLAVRMLRSKGTWYIAGKIDFKEGERKRKVEDILNIFVS